MNSREVQPVYEFLSFLLSFTLVIHSFSFVHCCSANQPNPQIGYVRQFLFDHFLSLSLLYSSFFPLTCHACRVSWCRRLLAHHHFESSTNQTECPMWCENACISLPIWPRNACVFLTHVMSACWLVGMMAGHGWGDIWVHTPTPHTPCLGLVCRHRYIVYRRYIEI